MTPERIALVEDILLPFDAEGMAGYKNHVYRLINFALSLEQLDEEERTKLTIAACFHDLGLFTHETLDYLPPSADHAREYLVQQGLEAWSGEISTMIDQHHKVRRIGSGGLAELFRKADLIDFSLGLFRFDIGRSTVKEIKRSYP